MKIFLIEFSHYQILKNLKWIYLELSILDPYYIII
jgi:hypothetical protein